MFVSKQVGVTAGTRRGKGVNFSVTRVYLNKLSVTVTVTVRQSSCSEGIPGSHVMVMVMIMVTGF
jgi:hypothetical protein